jgi:hypothetical protein
MFEIQVTKNIILFPSAPSLKNLTVSLSNEKIQKKPHNFHNVPKFPPLSTTLIQIPKPLEDHC